MKYQLNAEVFFMVFSSGTFSFLIVRGLGSLSVPTFITYLKMMSTQIFDDSEFLAIRSFILPGDDYFTRIL